MSSKLNLSEQIYCPPSKKNKSLFHFKMEEDDSVILSYIYRNFRPKRHLEFGTWKGFGTTLCLESCEATVWTINLLEGEKSKDDKWLYYESLEKYSWLPTWVKKLNFKFLQYSEQTDSFEFIGQAYKNMDLGNRVCQIYCNSKYWDTSNYPLGFFDTIMIDGGHTKEAVSNDMHKAMPLLKPGGLIFFHDYCPKEEIIEKCPSTRGAYQAIRENMEYLEENLYQLFWVNPSWLLIGQKMY